jgi:hypothetical protein
LLWRAWKRELNVKRITAVGVAKHRPTMRRRAPVINLSLGELPVVGQLQALNQDVEDTVTYAWDHGSLVV